jgi:hypothetical protein
MPKFGQDKVPFCNCLPLESARPGNGLSATSADGAPSTIHTLKMVTLGMPRAGNRVGSSSRKVELWEVWCLAVAPGTQPQPQRIAMGIPSTPRLRAL